MEHVGVTFIESLSSAEKYAALAAAPYELYGLESIKLPFGMTVEAEILGAKIDFGDDYRLPQVRKGAFDHPDKFEIPENLGDCGRIPLIRKSVEILKKKYETRVAVTTSIVGPFSLANMIFGFERLLMWIITEPELYGRCLEATTQFAVRYCSLLEEMGADIIQIGEAACSGDLVSVEDYEKNIMPYHTELCSAISVPSVVHICGNVSRHFEFVSRTGVNGFSFDDGNDMSLARKHCKGKVALLGYVHPIEVLRDGTVQQVRDKCRECLDEGVDILHAGCSWPPDVPDENAAAFVDSVKC
jgi:MtaA/CmuA family methyltransferase